MRTDDLDYELPEDRIAITPACPRDSAKLLVVERSAQNLSHRKVFDLPELLQPGDLLVFNHSKVIPAQFQARRVSTGGKVGGLFLGEIAGQWELMLESGGLLTVGESIELEDRTRLELIESLGAGTWLALPELPVEPLRVLLEVGTTPLPPYIQKARKRAGLEPVSAQDGEHYNTIYAGPPGSVAAPTAGLHFTRELMGRLDRAGIEMTYVTLHVGAGTFVPIRSELLADHKMHSEWFEASPQALRSLRKSREGGRRVIPIGTTSVRTLESISPAQMERAILSDKPCSGNTDLFITPGFEFQWTDGLMTNFHLPRSTLLALVAALPGVGLDRLKHWYGLAIEQQYRFFSYGDAMLLI